ncbi:MAG TPA: tetratricopeptide repeat protein [Candidatus Tectomicrobia bacterium]
MVTVPPLILSDCYGLPVTSRERQAVHWYNQGLQGLLGFRQDTPDCFQKALAFDPTFAMAHCHLGVHYFLEESEDMVARARACFEQARAGIAGLTERERNVVETLDLWGNGRVREAIDRMQAALQARPREAILLQRLYFIYFVQGASEKLRDLPASVLRHYVNDSYVLGMYSFGLEETHDFARAFETGQQALACNAEDVWALHALTHAAYETGAFATGVRLLEEGLQHCDGVGAFRNHILWHLALFLWEQGQYQRTLQLYHKEFADPATLLPPNFVDAVSLLWRLNLTGLLTAAEWQALTPSLERLRHVRTYLFNQVHIALGLTGAQRLDWAMEYLASLRAHINPGRPSLLGDVGLPLVEGLIAYARGEYAQVVDGWLPIRGRILEVGGSHAQRELFTDILLDAALRVGAYDVASDLLTAKRRHRPDRPLALFALEKMYARQGHTGQAAAMGTAARSLWQKMGADQEALARFATGCAEAD